MAESGVNIDKATFGKRLKQLYDHWKANNGLWANSTAILVPTGSSSEDLRYLKSLALHLWLLGYELPDTVLAFTPTELHVLSSQKKVDVLKPLEGTAEEMGVRMVFHVKPKAEDGSAQLNELFSAISQQHENGKPQVVGILPKDQHTGKFYETFTNALAAAGVATADVAAAFADLLSVKDNAEIMNHKKAAMLAARVLKDFVITKIEKVIDEGKSVKHSKLAEQTEQAITDPTKIGVKLKQDNCDIAYPPLFQSGGKYDFRMSAQSNDDNLHGGVIVCSVGARYSFYCSNISRTIFINPTKKQEAEYAALLQAQEAVIAALQDGATTSTVADAALKALKDAGQPDLVERLSKALGHGMGLELRETNSSLPSRGDANPRQLRAGQVYNVALSLTNLENPEASNEKDKVYAMQVADTVVVTESGKSPEVATASCPKTFDKVSYRLNEGSDGEDGGDEKLADLTNGLGTRKALRSDDPNHKSAEAIRKERQEELVAKKNQETLDRLTLGRMGSDGGGPTAAGRKISEVMAYRSISDYPVARDLTINVDPKNETILLPVYGVLVPFHITTIKNVTHAQDGDHAHIRVTFNFSGNYEPYTKFAENCVFLKELSFRSSDVRHAARVVQEIKVLRSSVTTRDKEQAERATLVAQEKLIQGKRVYKLPDLWMRPALGGKGRKVPGTLEAHANGFRYVNPRHPNEPVHVMYRNIKHAFFQPAENEMITILHFHLINPIMLGNKKTKDVQFYAEVMDVVQTLDGGRRNMYDPDEIEEEQRERERRNKVNSEFQSFVKRVQELWEKDFSELRLEFDIPFRELGFHGVPHRATAFVIPTVNCLVELSEMPFTVVSLQDIEVINLERVGFNLKNFDMAVVFKDFSRDVLRIDAIPSKSLDTIKDWLNSVGIKYYESKLNLAWKPILKNIMEDPEGFIENGGWEFLNMEKSDSEGEEGSEMSEDYAPEESDEDEDDSDDDESDDGSVVNSADEDDEDEDDEEDEDEEAGKSWEELEEEARADDKVRSFSDDEDDRRKAAKRKGGSSSTQAAKRRR